MSALVLSQSGPDRATSRVEGTRKGREASRKGREASRKGREASGKGPASSWSLPRRGWDSSIPLTTHSTHPRGTETSWGRQPTRLPAWWGGGLRAWTAGGRALRGAVSERLHSYETSPLVLTLPPPGRLDGQTLETLCAAQRSHLVTVSSRAARRARVAGSYGRNLRSIV